MNRTILPIFAALALIIPFKVFAQDAASSPTQEAGSSASAPQKLDIYMSAGSLTSLSRARFATPYWQMGWPKSIDGFLTLAGSPSMSVPKTTLNTLCG